MKTFRTACALVATAMLAACGTGADQPAAVKMGTGVTPTTIQLGVLTDLTGPFRALAASRVTGYRVLVDEVNQRGGVCGRRLELDVRDHALDVGKALKGYVELEPRVLGFLDVTGTQIMTAVEPDLRQTRMLVAPASWARSLLDNPHVMLVGATYDTDVLNGLDHLVRHGIIGSGSDIGHLHTAEMAAEEVLKASAFAAAHWGMTVHPHQVDSASGLDEPLRALRAAGTRALVLNTDPQRTAAIMTATMRIGWEVPLLIGAIGYDPTLLDLPLGAALAARALIVSPSAPYGSDIPGARHVAEAVARDFPTEKPNGAINHAYAVALAFQAVLTEACRRGDLTRDGIAAALASTRHADTQGITGPLEFSHTGRPSTNRSFISRPNPTVPGTLALVEDQFESPLVALRGTRGG
ncbi:ABC transporter substrate-binding protein [Lentzea sp. NPDC092896]|uniref:ABC transporter substrate-binding protein n=1 Tax=Lentzea sp. NPDC092896 TaxID=3364127 RepID=UPI0038199632